MPRGDKIKPIQKLMRNLKTTKIKVKKNNNNNNNIICSSNRSYLLVKEPPALGSNQVGDPIFIFEDIHERFIPPVKLWLTPTIEVAILIMSFYTALFFLLTFLVLKRKEFS